MSEHPLPWNKVRHALGHSITDANGGLVAEAMTEAEADAILAVTNKVPALVEACKACKAAMYKSEDCGCTDHLDCTADAGKFWTDALYAARDALAAFKTP